MSLRENKKMMREGTQVEGRGGKAVCRTTRSLIYSILGKKEGISEEVHKPCDRKEEINHLVRLLTKQKNIYVFTHFSMCTTS